MIDNPIEILTNQIALLEEKLKSETNNKTIIEIKKHIAENKAILETNYNKLVKETKGKSLRELRAEVDAMGIPVKRATGIKILDNFFGGGIEEETFINLVGESGSGKSTLGMEILLNIAEHNKSVFFSFEMGKKRTVKKLSRFSLTDNQLDNLIIDLDSYNVEQLKTEITIYSQRDGIKFFMIDSKMKLKADGFKDDYKMISFISNELSKLTQQLGIIVILINQISEENLKNNRVSLKGSGDQIYDSDIVLVYKKVQNNNNIRHLQVFKNRTGNEELGTIETTLEDNRTVGVGLIQETEFSSDNDFIGGML